MTKKELRQKYRVMRQNLSDREIAQASLDIANRFLQLPIWEKETFHVFLPILEKREVDTETLLHILSGREKNIVISRSDFETGTLSHYLLDDHTVIVRNAYGIPEPIDGDLVPVEKIDVIVVPLLAFDRYGHRIGYGKGFYDRFLAECRDDAVTIGVSFFEAEKEFEDVGPHDVRLKYCVTPHQTYDFNPSVQ